MYFFAEFSIQLLGTVLVALWVSSVVGASGRPSVERELASGGMFLGAYALIVGLPFLFLWRAYRGAVRSFVAPEDEVVVPPRPLDPSDRIALAVVAVLVVLAAVTVVMFVRAR
jgi:hypothetical protein